MGHFPHNSRNTPPPPPLTIFLNLSKPKWEALTLLGSAHPYLTKPNFILNIFYYYKIRPGGGGVTNNCMDVACHGIHDKVHGMLRVIRNQGFFLPSFSPHPVIYDSPIHRNAKNLGYWILDAKLNCKILTIENLNDLI